MKCHLHLILSLQLLTICNEGESAPLNNVAGPLLAALLILLVVATYQFYVHFSDIKFYCTLYFRKKNKRITMADGMRVFTINFTELTPTKKTAEIQPKDSPINISFNNLSLALKSVSIPLSLLWWDFIAITTNYYFLVSNIIGLMMN